MKYLHRLSLVLLPSLIIGYIFSEMKDQPISAKPTPVVIDLSTPDLIPEMDNQEVPIETPTPVESTPTPDVPEIDLSNYIVPTLESNPELFTQPTTNEQPPTDQLAKADGSVCVDGSCQSYSRGFAIRPYQAIRSNRSTRSFQPLRKLPLVRRFAN